MKDLISIIVPFLNSESTIKKCIESILNQTIKNYEIILVDNSSTDLSKEIAISYSKKFDFISYYNIKEKSVSKARNLGLAKSKGNIICFIDSDDSIHKDYLKVLSKYLNKNDISICNYTNNYKLLSSNIKATKSIDQNNAFSSILSDKKIRGYVWNKMFKKEIIQKNNIKFNEELKIGEDIDFVFDYINYCKNISFIDSNLYYYNNNKNNTVNNIENYKYALDSWINLFNKYKKYNKSIKNMNLINYFYLKKYYELKYYKKNIIKNKNIYFSDKVRFDYKLNLFIYKNFTWIIILCKKVRNKI